MFITFEGIDGCGKSTQLALLADFLRAEGYDVVTTREPGGTDFSEQIRQLLLFSDYKINPVAELFLFEAARAQLVDTIIKPALSSGKIVLSDRFYDSTTAYQGYGRGLSTSYISICNSIIDEYGAKPDITFFLDVSLENSLTRRKNSKIDRIETASLDFFQKVIDGYHQIAKNEPERVFKIDANTSKDKIFLQIKEKLVHLKCIFHKRYIS